MWNKYGVQVVDNLVFKHAPYSVIRKIISTVKLYSWEDSTLGIFDYWKGCIMKLPKNVKEKARDCCEKKTLSQKAKTLSYVSVITIVILLVYRSVLFYWSTVLFKSYKTYGKSNCLMNSSFLQTNRAFKIKRQCQCKTCIDYNN